MNVAGLPEGTPILCRNCGGGMDLHADSSISCRYCGARDQLPLDQLGRVLEIKNRLAQAEQRAGHVRGFDATFAGVFEDPRSFVRVMGVYVVFGSFVLLMSGSQLYEHFLPNVDKLDSATVAEVVVGQLMGPLAMLGIGCSFGVALLVGRHHYRKRLRPLLIARPPPAPNAPFACRACGGSLPAARDASVVCPYCHTSNLVPQELHGSHAAALLQEAEAAKQQLQRAHGTMVSISARMRTALIVCVVAVFALAYLLPMIAMAVLAKR
jgi:DNA-directed RNA polymerase subunit RPC12/RpoP